MDLKRSLKNRVAAAGRLLGYEIHRIPTSRSMKSIATQPVPEGIRGVHYGCGSNIEPEWLNLDIRPPSEGVAVGLHFLAIDVSREHPFADASFELGYAEDFLEHLSQADSLVFLSEARRTLRPGGVLRLSFPGLEGVLRKHYLGGSIAELAKAQQEAYEDWGHVHFYSQDELSLVARHFGFRKIEFLSFRESPRPELARMDTRSDQADLNTYAELTK